MSTLDLHEAVTLVRGLGVPATVEAVLESIGIAPVRTLESEPHRIDPDETICLGRFQVRSEIGRGGMGRVMEARDPELHRSVAVKVLINPSEVTAGQLARFVAEAQITSQLQHPNIVPVHEMGITDAGKVYFVMKRVAGRSLRQIFTLLRGGDGTAAAEWPRTRLLHAFIQVCNAVAYANDRGVLHRDLKPDNIMLGAFGEVLLMDWGVARVLGDPRTEAPDPVAIDRLDTLSTQEGSAIGTPGFMSPEQARGDLELLTPRSEVWSLGAILYELLTLERAYQAPTLMSLLFAVMRGPPEDPCTKAPGRRIPAEIAQICLRALATDPADRFADAGALSRAVEEFLEGSRRRAAARLRVAEGVAAWDRYLALAGRREELTERIRALESTVDPWAPIDAKADLVAARRALAALGPDRAGRYSEVLAACDAALSADPGHPEARALLAGVHYQRFEEAEADRNEEARLLHHARVLEHDDGTYAPLLRGTGSLSLTTDPPGATVDCARFDTGADFTWPLVDSVALGTTPLAGIPLEPGSYLLTLRAPGRHPTRYPVHIPRGAHWRAEAVRLPPQGSVPAESVYVPAGPFVAGSHEGDLDAGPERQATVAGFLIARHPVTVAAYCAFINATHGHDPEEAWARVPRQESGTEGGAGQYWARPTGGGVYVPPSVDQEGDHWDPAWPISSVSWHDAVAYAAWRTAETGIAHRLPTELEWEKAARGVDGRRFPWGDGFDPTLCRMRDSRPGRPQPEPVGTFAQDLSPYGVSGMAGNMRDWCGDATFDGDPARRPARGGAWFGTERTCRVANRYGHEPWRVVTIFGFRLVRELG